jgi:hypothetical protein
MPGPALRQSKTALHPLRGIGRRVVYTSWMYVGSEA